MAKRDPEVGEVVKAPRKRSKKTFPVVGVDKTPTPEMIAQGLVGNGAMDLLDGSVQIAYHEQHERRKAERDERRQQFNEEAKDALSDSIKLHHKIVKRGLDVMERLETPQEDRPVTRHDMAVLAMAQKSGKEIADRGMGRSVVTKEAVGNTSSLLTLIQKRTQS